MDVICVIENIKNKLEEVIKENDIKYLDDININDLLVLYSADLCNILLNFYPGATIMMNKSYKTCAILINGVVYNGYGICSLKDYFMAKEEDIMFISKSFPKLSDGVLDELNKKIYSDKSHNNFSLVLRKNNNKLI